MTPTWNTTPEPRQPVYAIVCPVCRFDIDGYTDPAEATHLTAIHNDVHHGRSRSDAFVIETTDDGTQPPVTAQYNGQHLTGHTRRAGAA